MMKQNDTAYAEMKVKEAALLVQLEYYEGGMVCEAG